MTKSYAISLTWLLEVVKPAYAETWAQAKRDLLDDAFESETIALLREELRENGSFRQPIGVTAGWTIGNGMHRVIASWLEGVEAIRICRYEDVLPDDVGTIAVTFTVHQPCPLEDDDALTDAVFGMLRSLRIDGTWTETSVLSGHNGKFTAYYNWPLADHATLTEAMAERVRRWGGSLTVVGVDDGELDPGQVSALGSRHDD